MTQSELMVMPNFLVASLMLVLFLGGGGVTFFIRLRGRRRGGCLRFIRIF